jgi:carbonic anhydrase/acetyltransferase-like protein (isoleucine patch superfamily)
MFYLFFPLVFFIGVILLILSSIIIAKFVLSCVNLIHKPKEGVFNRNKKDKDYCYWSLRSIIKKWPVWLTRHLSLPLLETITFKVLGVKTSFSNSLNEGWVDCEFVEFGKNVKIGQGSLIMSNIIVQDKLIIKKVKIKDKVIIGAHAVVLPGTVIEPNTILDVISMTTVNQHLEGDTVYHGVPAKKVEEIKIRNNKKALETLIFEKSVKKELNEEDLSAHVKELSVPFHFYIITGWIIIGCSFIIPGFLFILFLFGFLIPNILSTSLSLETLLNMNIIVISIFTPLILIGMYLLHLFFVALFTKWFYKLADKRGPEQGIYDRNLDESSTVLDYYHFRSFLFKYPIFAFIHSPFPWLINWELRFIKSNRVGKNTIFEETFFHSHIDFGINCYIGTFAHITNHLVDGVYGEENLTFFGASISDNCILSCSNGALPGLEMGDNSTILPMCAAIKYDKLGKNGIYGGFPAKKLSINEIKEILGGEYNGEEEI